MSSFQNQNNTDDDDNDDSYVQIIGVLSSSTNNGIQGNSKAVHDQINHKNDILTRHHSTTNNGKRKVRQKRVENPYLVHKKKKVDISDSNDVHGSNFNSTMGGTKKTLETSPSTVSNLITKDSIKNTVVRNPYGPGRISSTTQKHSNYIRVKNPYGSHQNHLESTNRNITKGFDAIQVYDQSYQNNHTSMDGVNKDSRSTEVQVIEMHHQADKRDSKLSNLYNKQTNMNIKIQNKSKDVQMLGVMHEQCKKGHGSSQSLIHDQTLNDVSNQKIQPSFGNNTSQRTNKNNSKVNNPYMNLNNAKESNTEKGYQVIDMNQKSKTKREYNQHDTLIVKNARNQTCTDNVQVFEQKYGLLENNALALNEKMIQSERNKSMQCTLNPITQSALPQQTSSKQSALATTMTTVALSLPNTLSSTSSTSSKPSAKIKPTLNLPPLPEQLQYDENRLKQVDDEFRLKLIQNAKLNSEFKNGWKLLPHQKSGVLKGLLMRRLVLAFDMGLGKTLVACVWAKAFVATFENMKVYIVAPVSLKDSWRKTAKDTVELRCKEEGTTKKGKIGTNKRKKAKNDCKGNKSNKDDSSHYDIEIFSWAKVPPLAPKSVEQYIVICDEAHHLQNMESTRTKDTMSLVSDERCKGVLLLTGTPMKNGKPCNLFPLLRATRHPFGDDQRLYETFFCNGQQRQYGHRLVWDASGSSNLNVLNAHIVSHVFHKTKEDCLKSLPAKTREYKQVPVSSKFELQHNRAIHEMQSVQKSLDSFDKDSGNEAILGAFARVRLIASLAKIDATVALAKKILKEESSLVIFTHFVQVAKDVRRKLDEYGWQGELLVGETPAKNRQEMVDRFQAGISPVFVTTFGAGGVGITLTAASTIILLDRPWTPGDALQAEDRVRRIGQQRAVKSIWLRAFQIDTQIDDLIEEKTMNSSAVISGQGSESTNHGKKAPKISVRKLVDSILSKTEVGKLRT